MLLLAVTTVSAQETGISLAGHWEFQVDSLDAGIRDKWYMGRFTDSIQLPGSMLTNGKGDAISLTTRWTGSIYDSSYYFSPYTAKYRQPGHIKIPFWLNPLKHYVGAAWYQRSVTVPASWTGKRIMLFLERAHIQTQVWVNGVFVGKQNSLVAPHEYDISAYCHAGVNRVVLRIDNSLKEVNPGQDAHSVSDHTQGNWNGVIGTMQLKVSEKEYIKEVQVFPDVPGKTAAIRLVLANATDGAINGDILVHATGNNGGKVHRVSPVKKAVRLGAQNTDTVWLSLPMGNDMFTWSEYQPALYRLTVQLVSGGRQLAAHSTTFGMRSVAIAGREIRINDHPITLRGTLNNCEFPLTGYPSTDVREWERILKVIQSYGLNHVRFHSWCPPEAAFEAADKLGVYLQPEAPSWPNHGVAIGKGMPVDQYLYDETARMLQWYGNHPSFIMLSAGNEPAGNQVPYLNAYVDYWKAQDTRRLYTGMSVGGSWPVVDHAQYQVRGGVRGLTWDKERPETYSNYAAGLAKFDKPFIAHEMGQWCVFPDFGEVKSYTGAYRAYNFDIFRESLQEKGMLDQAGAFLQASGKLQALCYKHEIEKTLRTPGYTGFQLLGLQDFPGQGTALVGVVNAFWKPKSYTNAAAFRQFCNDVVPLVQLPKFVYKNSDTLPGSILVANAKPAPMLQPQFQWVLKNETGAVYAQGTLGMDSLGYGNGQKVGDIRVALHKVLQPEKLTLSVRIAGTAYQNNWDIWVYPDQEVKVPQEVYYTTQLNDSARQVLERGGKVFFNAAGKIVKGKEVVMYFQPVFWNTSWFQMKPPHVTGMVIAKDSKAFAGFPTEGYSNLQWWEIANKAQVMVLEDFPAGFKPLVQPIDTWFLNRRLGLIMEVAVGKGKLILSSADLGPAISNDKPAARQLFASLMQYMQSSDFAPTQSVSFETVADLLKTPSRFRFSTHTADSPDELKPNTGKH
ncbi:beta-galactosidase [Filimonas lacunae]|nr:beta-galactosidase [Filimonas lacunae]